MKLTTKSIYKLIKTELGENFYPLQIIVYSKNPWYRHQFVNDVYSPPFQNLDFLMKRLF